MHALEHSVSLHCSSVVLSGHDLPQNLMARVQLTATFRPRAMVLPRGFLALSSDFQHFCPCGLAFTNLASMLFLATCWCTLCFRSILSTRIPSQAIQHAFMPYASVHSCLRCSQSKLILRGLSTMIFLLQPTFRRLVYQGLLFRTLRRCVLQFSPCRVALLPLKSVRRLPP
jgi:hypothetical protein